MWSEILLNLPRTSLKVTWNPLEQSSDMLIEAVDGVLHWIQTLTQAEGVNLECEREIISLEAVIEEKLPEVTVLLWKPAQNWTPLLPNYTFHLESDGRVLYNSHKTLISALQLDRPPSPPIKLPEPEVKITLKQLEMMKTGEKVCLAVNGQVYNVRNYLDKHPGGRVIRKYVGKDASEAFSMDYVDRVHPWVDVTSQGDVERVGVLSRH